MTVEIRATHPYGFRPGEWAEITAVEWLKDRACYRVRFRDGKQDSWPIHDPSDPYEFRRHEFVITETSPPFYRDLVARGEKQTWTPEDEERLKRKVRALRCDFCDEGLPLKNGWHTRVDPEGIEGTARMPCMRERKHHGPIR